MNQIDLNDKSEDKKELIGKGDSEYLEGGGLEFLEVADESSDDKDDNPIA